MLLAVIRSVRHFLGHFYPALMGSGIGCKPTSIPTTCKIGGGNHFAEIQQTDAVLSAAHLPAHYDPNAYQLLVHSGSRGLGGG